MTRPAAKRFRVRRAAVRLAAGLALVLLAIELLARWNVRSEQASRNYLGDRLFTEVVGNYGEPVIFIAGLQGSTRYWKPGFDQLAKDHRVIYVDLLGFGRSPWPDLAYTLDDQLSYLRRTLVALGATRNVTFVAHSFGTIIAAHYAERYPDDVKRLFLLGAPVYDGEAEARERISEMSPLAAAFSLRPVLAREACLLMGATRPLLKRLMPSLQPDLPPEVASDAVLHTWPAFRGAMRNVILAKPLAAPLAVVGWKVIFIHGTKDSVTPLPRIRALAGRVGGRVAVVASDHRHYAVAARPLLMKLITG